MHALSGRGPAIRFSDIHHLQTPEAEGVVDADMGHVLTTLDRMGALPIEFCTIADARRQPTLTDALARLLDGSGIGSAMSTVQVEDAGVPVGEREIAARVYRPAAVADSEQLPIIVYLHDGGFVLGDLAQADVPARLLAERCRALVVAGSYAQLPEASLEQAQDDAYATWLWAISNGVALGGDPARFALVGEGSGANLAAEVALRAARENIPMPARLVLITPMTGGDLTAPSYLSTLRVRPLGAPARQWLMRQAFGHAEAESRLDLCGRDDLADLPPTLVIMAELDPLRSEGEALVEALTMAGIDVTSHLYEGVTHGFFGLGRLVNKAMFAEAEAVRVLNTGFDQHPTRPAFA